MVQESSEKYGVEGVTGFPLREYLRVILDRKWTFLLVFSVVCFLGVFYTISQPKIYQAETVLVINPEPPNINLIEGSESQQWYFRDTYFDTQIKIMQSRHVASRVVSDLHLAEDLEFYNLRKPDEIKRAREIISSIDPVDYLLQKVSVEALLETRLVKIKVKHPSARMAALIADAIAAAYQEQNTEHRIKALEEAFSWLETQTKHYEEKVKASSESLNSFKSTHKILYSNPVEQQKLSNEQLGKMQVRLLDIEAERLNAEYMLKEISKLKPEVGHLSSLEILTGIQNLSVLKNKYLEKSQEEERLLVTYLENTPQVQVVREEKRLIEEAVKAAFVGIRAGYQAKFDALSGLERQLQGRGKLLRDEALALDQLRLMYEQMELHKQEQQRLFEMMQRRLNEVNLNRLLDSNNIRILDKAVAPKSPVSPRVFVYLFITLIGALLSSLAVVFIIDIMDISIKGQVDIEKRAGMDFLGVIPAVPRDMLGRVRNPYEYLKSHMRSSFAECVRTLRTTLSFLLNMDGSKVLLITSPSPLEGKSTTAMTLAFVSALAGQKVVMIEGDLRRPRLAKGLGMDKHDGLSAVMSGKKKLTEVLRETGVEGLSLLPCGDIPENPSEIFQMDKFEEIMSYLQSHYDLVIIDSPPVSMVSDALVLSRFSHGVLLVVRAGKTEVPQLIRSKELLNGVGAPLLGVVINDYQERSKSYGSYSYYS